MPVLLLTTPADWADAVAALPATAPLPARTVLVPSERHAHALRRALAESGRGAALAGTRFLGPVTAAEEVLRAAGVPFARGEEALRRARLLARFREDLALAHFDPALLRATRGWEEAFAGAIDLLDAADLLPADLPGDTAAAGDLAALWREVEGEAGESFGAARVCREAAERLEADPRAWPLDGPVLAVVTGHEHAALARFVRAIPGVTLGIRAARPAGARHLARVTALHGAEAAARLADEPPAPRAGATERDLLAAFLFANAERLADPERPRSRGPDGTVSLEEHAGVEAELDAAAAWVARQVLERGHPLEDIAVLVPEADPLAQLVAERIARLPHADGALPVHVAGGLPALATAAGARLAAVLRALRAHLAADALAAVLPALRAAPAADGEPRSHLTHGEATELTYALGTVGGNAADPAGALAWSTRAAVREAELEGALARARLDEDSAARESMRLERTLRSLRAVRPALDALVGVARTLVHDAPLAAVWDALSDFLERFLLAPGPGAPLAARLADALAPARAGAPGTLLRGADVLDVIEAALRALRVPCGRFGDPAVYVGTVAGAAGLPFAAVRVVGLCEGALPSAPREDPVLPDALRRALEEAAPGRVLPRAEDRVAAQRHALLAVIAGARGEVVLSAPRVDLARTEREPSSLLVEAAAALARPDATTGAPGAAVPDGRALRRDAFRPARAAAAAFRAACPVGEGAWLDRVARVEAALPPAWSAEPALDLARIAALRTPAGALGPGDGVLGPGEPFPAVPGLVPERPISASALQQLVQCPRLFLMRRVLGWDEPASAPPLRELDALSFGSLLHRAVERFYREHGAAFVAREGTLARWTRAAEDLASAELEAFLSEVPLAGARVREKERERLLDAARAFLAYDWAIAGERRFVGVELAFGDHTPLAIDAGGITLHVRGYIDRVDVEGGATVVRDLKSGRAHPRSGAEAGPTPFRDVQLGLYQLAARTQAVRWRTPPRVIAAYAYASGRADVEERAFREDAAALERATETWLRTAAALLAHRAFTATPDPGDCVFCPFHALCGADGAARAAAALEDEEDGPLAAFRILKLGEEDEG